MTARGGAAHKQDHAKEANSGGFLPPSPLAEQATARQDEARQSCADIEALEPVTASSGKTCLAATGNSQPLRQFQ